MNFDVLIAALLERVPFVRLTKSSGSPWDRIKAGSARIPGNADLLIGSFRPSR